MEASSLSIEVLRGRSLVIELATSLTVLNVPLRTSAHAWSCMVGGLYGASDAAKVEVVVLRARATGSIHPVLLRCARTRWLTDLHPWRECVLQKYASVLWCSLGALARNRVTTHS